MTQIVLTLLGAFAVTVAAGEQPRTTFATDKARALLAYLALHPAQAHRRELLAALFWPEISQQAALTNLRQTFHRLRAGLDRASPGCSDSLFLVTRQTLQLNPATLTVDVRRFTDLLTESETHAHAALATCEPCLARLAEAATLYRGELLAGFGLGDAPAFEEWLLLRREFYHQQALLVLQKLTTAYDARGDYDQAHTYASRQLELDPYREDAHRQVMRLLALRGLTSQALTQYERCRTLLRTELGVAPAVETMHLAEQIRAGVLDRETKRQGDRETRRQEEKDAIVSSFASPPLPVSLSSPLLPLPHNLPAQLTPLVGREQAVAELCQRLLDPTVRLLTIVGAGGMGKTRLALAVGEASYELRITNYEGIRQGKPPVIRNYKLRVTNYEGIRQGKPPVIRNSEFVTPLFRDGVFFVSLAALTTVEAVAPAISAALGVNLPGEPRQALLQALRTKQILLILDNFEHLLEATALVVDLLQAAPGVCILATSRERLHVRGEHLYRIPPLQYAQPVPSDSAVVDVHRLARSLSSVQLFTQSAQREQAAFVVDEANVAAVLQICRLVQGMPLGLELAAAWVGTLSLPEIADAITQSNDFLTSGWRDIPERQQSLRAVFEWSWRLLTPPEQQVLRQLAVFQGGFARSAAQVVTGAAFPLLTSLVHKSLVQWDERAAPVGGRYALHELLRQFVAEKLAQLPVEQATVQSAHSHFYLTHLAERTLPLLRHEPQTAGAEIQGELDNIRQAWAWAASQGDSAALEPAVYGWWQFCSWRGLIGELRQSLAVAIEGVRTVVATANSLEYSQPALRLLSKLLAIHANLLFAQGVDEEMAAQAEEAIALGQRHGSREGECFGYFVLGRAYQEFEKTADAMAAWQKAIMLAQADQQSPTPSVMVRDTERLAYMWLRGAAMAMEDYAGGRAYILRALATAQAMGHVRAELACLTNLAWNDFVVGDYDAAQQRFEQGFALACTLDHRWAEMATCSGLGEVLRRQGRYGQALAWWERSLTIAAAYSAYDEALLMASLLRLHSYLGDQTGAEAWRSRLFALLEQSRLPKDCQRQGLLAAAVHAYYGGDLPRALTYAEQVRQLTGPSEILTVRAEGFVVLGHIQAGLHQWTAAAASYHEALACYTKVGNQSEATEAQAGLAQIALAQGERVQAQAWVERILPVLAMHPHAGLTTPFFTYLTCYQVLAANQDKRAQPILEQGWRLLLDDAVGLTEPALRRSFLEGVAVHRELQKVHEASG